MATYLLTFVSTIDKTTKVYKHVCIYGENLHIIISYLYTEKSLGSCLAVSIRVSNDKFTFCAT